MSFPIGAIPPHVKVTWNATSLTTTFSAYRIYRRKSAGKPEPWRQIGEFAAPGPGGVTNDVESYYTEFRDYTAGWSPTNWDYRVSVVRTDNTESLVSSGQDLRNVVSIPDPKRFWLLCNEYPELNIPLDIVESADVQFEPRVQKWAAAGRDNYITANRLDRPGRVKRISARLLGFNDYFMSGDQLPIDVIGNRLWDPTRRPQSWCLLGPDGERMFGTVELKGLRWKPQPWSLGIDLEMTETASDTRTLVGWQGPSRLRTVPDAYVSHADNAAFDMTASESMTAMFYGAVLSTTVTDRYMLSKWQGDGPGWAFTTNNGAGKFDFLCSDGAIGARAVLASSTLNDGVFRVYGGYRDVSADQLGVWTSDVLTAVTATDTTTTTIANGLAVNMPGLPGVDLRAQMHTVCYAIWKRVLTATERQIATWAMLGYAGFELPGGTELYCDFRDTSSYPGTGTDVLDLSGNGSGRDGTITNVSTWLPKQAT